MISVVFTLFGRDGVRKRRMLEVFGQVWKEGRLERAVAVLRVLRKRKRQGRRGAGEGKNNTWRSFFVFLSLNKKKEK